MKKAKAKVPKWLLKQEGLTQHQWKARKRQDLKNLIAALHRYRFGCAYCPGRDGEVGIISRALKDLQASHSVKQWGR